MEGNQNDKIKCICGIQTNDNIPLLKCLKCGFFQHQKCMGANAERMFYLCPSCCLKRLNPLRPALEKEAFLIPPFVVKSVSLKEKLLPLNFTISKELELASPRGIELRCIELDGKSSRLHFPTLGVIDLNGALISRKTANSKGINLDQYIHRGTNQLTLANYSKNYKTYVAAVLLIEEITVLQYKERILFGTPTDLKIARNIFINRLNKIFKGIPQFKESGPLVNLCSDSNLIKTPCFSFECEHIEPLNFEVLATDPGDWECPLCEALALDLRADRYFEEISKIISQHHIKLQSIHSDRNGVIYINGTHQIIYNEQGPGLTLKNISDTNILSPIVIDDDEEPIKPCSKPEKEIIIVEDSSSEGTPLIKEVKLEKKPEKKRAAPEKGVPTTRNIDLKFTRLNMQVLPFSKPYAAKQEETPEISNFKKLINELSYFLERNLQSLRLAFQKTSISPSKPEEVQNPPFCPNEWPDLCLGTRSKSEADQVMNLALENFSKNVGKVFDKKDNEGIQIGLPKLPNFL